MIETMTPQEATVVLRNCGMRISPETLRDGLKDRRFSFGTYIPKESGSCVCFVYKKLLNDWIKERSAEQQGGVEL